MSVKPRVLVVDDEEPIRKLLRSRLERDGFEVSTASSAEEAQSAFQVGTEVGCVVTDLRMPGKDGFALMEWLQGRSKLVRTVVITGHGEKDVAVKALRHGASDYLEKPFDMDQLSHAVRRCMREFQLERENQDLVGRLEARVERMEGKAEEKTWYESKDASMAKVNEWLGVLRRESMRAEAEEPSVLILGESGTGKEGIARSVHARSRRGKGPWVAVNCANFSEQLLESELFGHERGAFTGANQMKRGLIEIARGGTLFLDELGEMDVKLQAKLLRVLQEKVFRRVGGTQDMESDVRVVAATNQNLHDRVKSGAFREDLYHRLSRVVIELPALRARSSDIVPMATQFAERAFRSRGKTFAGFTPDAEESLQSYGWPGNVRELLNVVERCALIHEGSGPIGVRGLSIDTQGGGAQGSDGRLDSGPRLEMISSQPGVSDLSDEGGYMGLKKRWSNSFEREYLQAMLRKHSGNVSSAAREAKLDRSNFLRLLRRHGLKAAEFRKVGSHAVEAVSETQAA
jgi:DNA-binding NtrC family response regulator